VIRKVRDDARIQLAQYRTERSLDDCIYAPSSPPPMTAKQAHFYSPQPPAPTALLSFDPVPAPAYLGGYVAAADAPYSSAVPYSGAEFDLDALIRGMPAAAAVSAPDAWSSSGGPQQQPPPQPAFFSDWNFPANNW
jgi:hypothetical protein